MLSTNVPYGPGKKKTVRIRLGLLYTDRRNKLCDMYHLFGSLVHDDVMPWKNFRIIDPLCGDPQVTSGFSAQRGP